MARFYAVFDPTYTNATLNSSKHERRFIGMNTGGTSPLSASAAILRNGLILSRSVLHNTLYPQLDSDNRTATTTRGVIIPYNVISFDSPSPNDLTWTNVYTGSAPGLRFESDPSIRISASVLSTDTSIVGPAVPVDGGTISKFPYLSASAAVNDITKNKIQSASNSLVNSGPYERLGNYPSRTLHSLYHDYDMTYFAWDDYTPGAPRTFTILNSASMANDYYYTYPFYFTVQWSGQYEYLADALAYPIVSTSFASASGVVSDSYFGPLAAGITSVEIMVDSDPQSGIRGIFSNEYYLHATASLREPFLSSSNIISDSPVATGAVQMNLFRLYEISLIRKATGQSETLCANYNTGTTTYYTSGNAGAEAQQTVLDNSGDHDWLYTNTNVNNPTKAAMDWYKVTGDSTVIYQISETDGEFYDKSNCT